MPNIGGVRWGERGVIPPLPFLDQPRFLRTFSQGVPIFHRFIRKAKVLLAITLVTNFYIPNFYPQSTVS